MVVPTGTPTKQPTQVPVSTQTREQSVQPTSRPSVTPTQDASLGYVEVMVTANLRGGPGTNFPIVGNAKVGDVLPFFNETEDGWFQLDESGKLWIGSTLVEITSKTDEINNSVEESEKQEIEAIDLDTPRRIEGSIYKQEDVSFGNTIRYSLFVTVPYPVTKDEVMVMCESMVEDFKKRNEFNALSIFVSDRPIGNVFVILSIARCDYAPNGVWGEANSVKTGDYSIHKFDYLFMPKMDDPIAALADRPTDEDMQVCSAWWNRSDELLEQGIESVETDEMVTKEIADLFGLTAKEVDEINWKCIRWPSR
jgi:hypothetical protein